MARRSGRVRSRDHHRRAWGSRRSSARTPCASAPMRCSTDLSIVGLGRHPRGSGPILFDQPPIVYLAGLLGRRRVVRAESHTAGPGACGPSASPPPPRTPSAIRSRCCAPVRCWSAGPSPVLPAAFLSLYMAAGWTEGLIAGRGWNRRGTGHLRRMAPRTAGGRARCCSASPWPCSRACRHSTSAIFGLEVNTISPALLGILPFLAHRGGADRDQLPRPAPPESRSPQR